MNRVWHSLQAYLQGGGDGLLVLLGGSSVSISSINSFSIASTASASSLSKLTSGDRSLSVPKISFNISDLDTSGIGFAIKMGGSLLTVGDWCNWGMGGVEPLVYNIGMDSEVECSGDSAVVGVLGED